MPPLPLFTVLILDLGDVLVHWSPDTKTEIPPRLLKNMMSSGTWMDYERGHLSQDECYAHLAEEFALPVVDIASAFEQARQSIRVDMDMAALVRELKASDDSLQVYALSNMSIPEYDFIRQIPFDWSIFDAMFPSGLLGERKPHKDVYDRFITKTGIDPLSAVFVDDKSENVSIARSFGIHGVVFESTDQAAPVLRDLFVGPVQRATRFMRANAGALDSVTDNGHAFKDNLSQLLILELTGDESLVSYSKPLFLWNFFAEKPLFLDALPDDLNTTAVAYTVLNYDNDMVTRAMDEILRWKSDQGTLFSCFDHSRRRVCPFVNVSVLTLFFRNGRGKELPEALDWVIDVLSHRRYMNGSRYYTSPDVYLYFVSRLLDCRHDDHLHGRVMPIFLECIKERVGVPGDPMELAMRVIVWCRAGLSSNEVDMQKLLAMQLSDGGWAAGWLCRYGRLDIKLGNRGFTTALAVKAIRLTSRRDNPRPLV
ncbi:HAD-like protein [Daedalea quercina L-15889]|uniref:HAD-like protein n=1 Tax=Daedalea quercina L-15889 TaxID=1314783 RepID=A0A165PXI8_9APHY|nr:HAD-like protein [Daedalea quercina L-15889]